MSHKSTDRPLNIFEPVLVKLFMMLLTFQMTLGRAQPPRWTWEPQSVWTSVACVCWCRWWWWWWHCTSMATRRSSSGRSSVWGVCCRQPSMLPSEAGKLWVECKKIIRTKMVWGFKSDSCCLCICFCFSSLIYFIYFIHFCLYILVYGFILFIYFYLLV